jgi:putative solute:sodium symporter small subunit
MQAATSLALRKKVRRLTAGCLVLWLVVTLVPVLIARQDLNLPLGNWPLDFWMAAQGCVLVYLLTVTVYAWLVNRWERQAGELSFEIPPPQDV